MNASSTATIVCVTKCYKLITVAMAHLLTMSVQLTTYYIYEVALLILVIGFKMNTNTVSDDNRIHKRMNLNPNFTSN